jgi:hypothetical protein
MPARQQEPTSQNVPHPHKAKARKHMEVSNNANSASLSMKIKETHKLFQEMNQHGYVY